MSLNLDDKKTVVAEVSAEVANAQSIIVAEYRGLGVVDLTALRANARKSGVLSACGQKYPGSSRHCRHAVRRSVRQSWPVP